MQPLTLKRGIVQLILLWALIGFATIAAFVYEGTQYIAERQQRFEMDNEIGFIENTLYNFVFHHQSQLADYAKLTTFVQAAMQPEHHQADLQDIMKSITLFDQHRPLALLDFEGMPIYATTPEAFAQLPAEELAPLLTGAEQRRLFYADAPNTSAPCLYLAIGIYYGSSCEGVLLCQLSLQALSGTHGIDESLTHGYLQLLRDGTAIASFGHPVEGFSKEIAIPELGLSLRYTNSDTALHRDRLILVGAALTLLTLLGVGILFSVLYLAERRLIAPIEHLSSYSEQLGHSDTAPAAPPTSAICEIQDLGKALYAMASRLHMREAALRASNRQVRHTHDQLQAQQVQLLRAEKMAAVGQLAAGLAHELNTPLGYIGTNLQALYDYADDMQQLIDAYEKGLQSINDTSPDSFAQVHRSVAALREAIAFDDLQQDIEELANESREGLEKMGLLVHHLRDFAHEDDDDKQLYDLEQGLDSTVNIASLNFKKLSAIDKQYGGIPPLLCYPHELNQAIMALLDNANQALVERGTIRITTYCEGEFACVQIADDGIGMDSDTIEHACNPFFTTRPVGTGSGLGLSMCYYIVVERHQGQLHIDSKEGQGTSVRLKIPLHASASPSLALEEEAHVN